MQRNADNRTNVDIIEIEKEEEKLVAYATFCFLWKHARQNRN